MTDVLLDSINTTPVTLSQQSDTPNEMTHVSLDSTPDTSQQHFTSNDELTLSLTHYSHSPATSFSVTPSPRSPDCIVPICTPDTIRRYNSTQTLFIGNEMRAPDIRQMELCLSKVLHVVLTRHSTMPPVTKPVFEEDINPLDYSVDVTRLPELGDIHCLVSYIFGKQKLSAECGVMAAVYIDRLLTYTGITLRCTNWRRILLGALLLADKVWCDLSVWNVDYARLFPSSTVEDINRLEAEYLYSLEFDLLLRPSVYATYYFELRSLTGDMDVWHVKPLDKETAMGLEAKSRGAEEEWKMKQIKEQRSKSLVPAMTTMEITTTGEVTKEKVTKKKVITTLSVEEFRKYFTRVSE